MKLNPIFRIAALESIKLKEEERKASAQRAALPPAAAVPTPAKKPDFVIRSHPKRSNLVSIITTEEEILRTLALQRPPAPPPAAPPILPPQRLRSPSPIYGSRSPPPRGYATQPYYYRSRSRSRSYDRARSPLSPRRYSPPSPRRWSPRLRGRSPPPASRWSPPPSRRSPLRPWRSPLGRRSPPPRRKSPFKRSPRSRSPLRYFFYLSCKIPIRTVRCLRTVIARMPRKAGRLSGTGTGRVRPRRRAEV
jgi:hypothetical protein